MIVNGRRVARHSAGDGSEDRQIFYLQLHSTKFNSVKNAIEVDSQNSTEVSSLSATLERLHSKVRASDIVVIGEGEVPLWTRFHIRGLKALLGDWPGVDRNLRLHHVFLSRNDAKAVVNEDAIVPASVEVPVIVGGSLEGLFSLLGEGMTRGGVMWLRVGLYEPFLSGPDILEPLHRQISTQGFTIQSQELAQIPGEPTSFAHFLASKA